MVKTCSRPGCPDRAVAQLTYEYAQSEVEVRAIGTDMRAGTYALCRVHLDRLKVPKGWRLILDDVGDVMPSDDAMEELATRIRQAGGLEVDHETSGVEHSLSKRANLVTLASRAHLRVVADASRYLGNR